MKRDDGIIKWLKFYPKYGCLVIAHTSEQQLVGTVSVNVLGLDPQEFGLHSGGHGDGHYDYFGLPTGYKTLHVPMLLESSLEKFKQKIEELLKKAQNRKKTERSAKGGNQGHQYTPAFIYALLLQAEKCQCFSECQCEDVLPKGGFTDNGLHTGGNPHNTSFALARSLWHWCTKQTGDVGSTVFRRMMTYLDLRIAEDWLRVVEELDGKPGEIRIYLDWAQCILAAASFKFCDLDAERFDIVVLRDYARDLHDKIDKMIENVEQLEAKRYSLSNVSSQFEGRNKFRNLVLNLNSEAPRPRSTQTLDEKRAQATRNIGMVPVFQDTSVFNVQKLCDWVDSPTLRCSSHLEDARLVVATVEDAFWKRAENGLEINILNEVEVNTLLQLVHRYRNVVNTLLTVLDKNNPRKTEIYSRELLVVWIAYCLCFTSSRKAYGNDLPNMGVALRYRDLEHLVLSDKRLWALVHTVKCFLQQNHVPKRDLFSLRCPEATLQLGEHFSRVRFDSIFLEERIAAVARENAYWKEVQRKQALVAELRRELYDLTDELRRYERRRDEVQRAFNLAASCHRRNLCIARDEEDRAVRMKEAEISLKSTEIKDAKTAPAPVVQPLPRDASKAHRWLFFLYMPPSLQSLATLSFTAQQMLMPKQYILESEGSIYGLDGLHIVEHMTTDLPDDSITAYYNEHQSSVYHARHGFKIRPEGLITLRGVLPLTSCRPRQVGPSDVERIGSPDDGVWYPDTWGPRMAWRGGPNVYDRLQNGKEFDPYRMDAKREWAVFYFTEQLERESTGEANVMQWTMLQDGGRSHDRGNKPISTQDSRPDWLSKPEYLFFGKTRAFPISQFRAILASLRDDCLPMNDTRVHTLIFQAAFHIGRISDSGEEGFGFPWKCDVYKGDIISTAKTLFSHLADDLCETPTNYSQLALLGELCGFFSAWDSELKRVSRRLAKAAIQWSTDVEQQLANSTEKNVIILRLKQCILLRHAILCHLYGPVLEECDVKAIIVLTARCRNLCLDGVSGTSELNRLESKCLDEMAGKLKQILAVVGAHPEYLTEALRCCISQFADDLEWTPFTSSSIVHTACFEATRCGCVYTINVLTGVILVDGMPPSSLPAEILDHGLYRRTFGSVNFEAVTVNSVLETIRPISGRRYRFFLNGNDLHIEEVDEKAGTRLELLDTTSIDKWGDDFPIRLQKMHSHWFYRDQGLVILRGPLFSERNTNFVLKLESESWAQSVEVSCFVIPEYLARNPVKRLMEGMPNYDKLVKSDGEPVAMRVLAKFEQMELIHILHKCNGEIHLHMPRFGLSFPYREGRLHCQEISRFCLSQNQLLAGALSGFHRYLVLECSTEDGFVTENLILPEGEVQRSKDGDVSVLEEDRQCDAQCQWHRYKIHNRYGTLKASNTTARLRLAAIHASTSMCTIDKRYKMTGAERAVELVRQCRTSKPLSTQEKGALENVVSVCEGRHPALSLLCIDLFRCSEQVAFLYSNESRETFLPTFNLGVDCDEINAYANKLPKHGQNCRSKLTVDEQQRVLGHDLGVEATMESGCFEIDISPSSWRRVECIESSIRYIVKTTIPNACGSRPTNFPLARPETLCALDNAIYDELIASWQSHLSNSEESFIPAVDWKDRIQKIREDSSLQRKNLESYLIRSINDGPDQGRHLAISFFRLSNVLPTATTIDLTRSVYDPDWILGFNPLLSRTSRERLKESILLWHRLCVIEDKLQRLIALEKNFDEAEITRELLISRVWDVTQYPTWLAFEVENSIQIRPEQFVVAQHLINNPGHVVQLNMGQGKTRVILPMLVLHWSFHDLTKNRKISRLNVLSSLFSEAHDFFREQLCGSIARLKVYLLPFCRDVVLDEHRIIVMSKFVEQCRRDRGMFLVAPEHRLSLDLKQIELHHLGQLDLCEKLRPLCSSTSWRDILDESDELLHHRFQLMYAFGSVEGLPAALHRFQAPQLLFRALKESPSVREWLDTHPEFVLLEEKLDSEATALSEACPNVRLNVQFASDELISEFTSLMANSVVSNPPYELDWICNHPEIREIKRVMSDPNTDMQILNLPTNHLDDVLSFRGLLAGGVLLHCLEKRHRVDYGISRPGKKRIAVPFRGADTPSLRSEFAQPDCAIMLTCLSYYSDGLDKEQLYQAFGTLLSLGRESRRKHYFAWFELASPRMKLDFPSEEVCKFDCIEKIDLSNVHQFSSLIRYYCHNMKTINFWLNSCVFPLEMQHYPQRLTGTAWNVAENADGGVIGFSGTNDNHRILPQQVQQYFAQTKGSFDSATQTKGSFDSADIACVWNSLMATNGLMLSRILQHTSECLELPLGDGCTAILNLVKKRLDKVHAVVDCGALFAGIPNRKIAKLLLDHLKSPDGESSFQGVVFFDNAESTGKWKVLERSGRLLPKDQSPVCESEAFAFFDELRCRGADLKLDSNAVAILTLGTKMCKDKFMQAAGRMRKLGRGQTLLIAGNKDVIDQVKNGADLCPVEVKHVLEWTLRNTCESNALGLVPWATQGMFHCTTYGNYDLVVEDERSSLVDIYGGSFEGVQASEVVRGRREHYLSRADEIGAALSGQKSKMLEEVLVKTELYGSHLVQTVDGTDEECERELELQREIEEEKEIEVPRLIAVNEQDWSTNRIFEVNSTLQLPKEAGVMSILAFITEHLIPESICRISWTGRVHGTRNFFMSVMEKSGLPPKSLSQYLRLVDVVILFPSGEVLLISEREADIMLEQYWEMQVQQKLKKGGGAILLHLSLARSALDGIIPHLSLESLTLSLGGSSIFQGDWLKDDILAEIQLFAGETAFRTEARRGALKRLLGGFKQSRSLAIQETWASAEPEHIVTMRGYTHCLPYSDLEQACKEVAKKEQSTVDRDDTCQ